MVVMNYTEEKSRNGDDCVRASITAGSNTYGTPLYGSREGAAQHLVESLAQRISILERQIKERELPKIFDEQNRCVECQGWGTPNPSGCINCGIRCMGG